MSTQRRARLSKLLRCLMAGLFAATPWAANAQDLLDSTSGTAPGPAQRSVTETGDMPAELEPEPGATATGAQPPGVKAAGTPLHWNRAPIRYKGEVGLLFTDTMPSGSPRSYDTQLYTRLDGSSYLKAPWFAAVEGGLGLTTGLQRSAESKSDNVTVTGDAGLTLFPVSRFPFHTFASVTNSRVNQDLIGSQYTSTTIGANQSYAPLNGRTNYSGGILYNRLNGDRFGSDTQVSANASMIAGLEQQQITLEGSAINDKRKEGQEHSSIYNLTAKDEFHEEDSLTVLSLASVNHATFHFVGADSTSSFMQATTSGSWTPIEDSPLQLSGGMHLSVADTQNTAAQTTTKVDTKSFGSALGANYRWNKNLRLSGNASAGVNQVRGDETRTTRLSSVASYSSDATPLGSYYYNYGLSGTATRSSVSRSAHATQSAGQLSGSQAELNETASHSVSKNERLDDVSMLSTRLTQGVSAIQGGGQQRTSLQHSGALTWTQNTDTRQLFAGATVTDQRSNLFTLDMLNLQFSASGDVSRYSTVSAAVTLQVSHQSVASGASSGAGSAMQTSTTKNAGAEATYVNVRAFGVLRLKFSSIFRADTFTRDARFTGTVGAPAEDIRVAWENRFDYTVGLLTLQFLGRLTQASGKTDGLLFASAQRRFGGFY